MNLHKISSPIPSEMQELLDYLNARWKGMFAFRWANDKIEESPINLYPDPSSAPWYPTSMDYWLKKMRARR